MKSFEPLFSRILVSRMDTQDTTEGGLFIPDDAKEKPQEGKVVAIGSEVKFLKEKDIVLFGKYAGTEIKLNGFTNLILEESEVLGRERK